MRVLRFALLLVGCTGGGSRVLTAGTETDPAIVTRACVGLPLDPIGIGDMSIDGNTLRVSVSYGGGCEEHTFAACWDGSITKSNPSTLSLVIHHDAHDDLCDAFVTRDLFIDLSDTPAGFGAPRRGEAANSIQLTQQ